MKKILFCLLLLAGFAAANTCTEAYFLAIKPYLIQSKNSPYIDSVRSRYDYTTQDDTLQIDKFTKFFYKDGRLEKIAFGYVGDTANQYTDYDIIYWSTDESVLSKIDAEELVSDSTSGDTTYIDRKCYQRGAINQRMQYKITNSYVSSLSIEEIGRLGDNGLMENFQWEEFSESFFRNDTLVMNYTTNYSPDGSPKEQLTYYVEDPNDDFKCYEYENDSLTLTLVYQKTDNGFSLKANQGTSLKEIFFVDPNNTTAIRKQRPAAKISPKARYFDLLGRYKFTK